MSLSRRAKRRDIIEPLCVEIALNCGWDGIPNDRFDYLFWRNGLAVVVEFKTGQAGLTDSQKDLIARGCPLVVIRSEEDAREFFK